MNLYSVLDRKLCFPLVRRPHAECGPGAGEAVPGGEADSSGGAEDDVRAGAGVPAATAVP